MSWWAWALLVVLGGVRARRRLPDLVHGRAARGQQPHRRSTRTSCRSSRWRWPPSCSANRSRLERSAARSRSSAASPDPSRAAVGGGHSVGGLTQLDPDPASVLRIDSASSHGLEWTPLCASLRPAARACARSWCVGSVSGLQRRQRLIRRLAFADAQSADQKSLSDRRHRRRRRVETGEAPRRTRARPQRSSAAAGVSTEIHAAVCRQPLGARGRIGHAHAVLAAAAAATEDVGEVAVIQDAGDLLAPAESVRPVAGVGLRFTRNGSSYDVSRISAGFRSPLGSRIELEDDDSVGVHAAVQLPVVRQGADPRVRQLRRQHHVRGGGPREHRAQRLARDDGPAARGAVLRRSRSVDGHRARLRAERGGRDATTVTWCTVRGFDKAADRHRAGQPAAERQRRDAVRQPASDCGARSSALSPGRAGRFATLDLSAGRHVSGGGDAAIGERFSARIRPRSRVADRRQVLPDRTPTATISW